MNKIVRRLSVILLLSLCLILFIAGGTQAASATSTAPKRLRVGTVASLTNFPVGVAWGRGIKLFFDKINEQGGINIGGQTYLFDFFLEDDEFSSEVAATAANKLVHQHKVKYMFGSILDNCAEAIYNVTSKNKVLYIEQINYPGGPADVSPKKPLLLRSMMTEDAAQDILFKYLRKLYPDVKNIVVSGADFYPMSFYERNRSIPINNGFKVLDTQLWPQGTEDFIPIATKILAKKPDAIHIFLAAWAPPEIRAIRQLGFKGPIISDTPLPISNNLRIAGAEASTDLLCCGMYDFAPPTKEAKEIMDLWAAKYKEPFLADAWLGWDNPWMLIQGMKKAQSIEPEKILAALETMTKPGDIKTTFGDGNIGGLKRFGVNRVLIKPWTITHIMSGKPTILEKTLIQE